MIKYAVAGDDVKVVDHTSCVRAAPARPGDVVRLWWIPAAKPLELTGPPDKAALERAGSRVLPPWPVDR